MTVIRISNAVEVVVSDTPSLTELRAFSFAVSSFGYHWLFVSHYSAQSMVQYLLQTSHIVACVCLVQPTLSPSPLLVQSHELSSQLSQSTKQRRHLVCDRILLLALWTVDVCVLILLSVRNHLTTKSFFGSIRRREQHVSCSCYEPAKGIRYYAFNRMANHSCHQQPRSRSSATIATSARC